MGNRACASLLLLSGKSKSDSDFVAFILFFRVSLGSSELNAPICATLSSPLVVLDLYALQMRHMQVCGGGSITEKIPETRLAMDIMDGLFGKEGTCEMKYGALIRAAERAAQGDDDSLEQAWDKYFQASRGFSLRLCSVAQPDVALMLSLFVRTSRSWFLAGEKLFGLSSRASESRRAEDVVRFLAYIYISEKHFSVFLPSGHGSNDVRSDKLAMFGQKFHRQQRIFRCENRSQKFFGQGCGRLARAPSATLSVCFCVCVRGRVFD